MIEGGGGGGGGCGCAPFLGQFFRATVLFVGFFQFTIAFFWVDSADICIFFAVYYVYFLKKSNSVLGTKFS